MNKILIENYGSQTDPCRHESKWKIEVTIYLYIYTKGS